MNKYIGYATGRRKTSVARVYMKPGTGQIIVNKKEFREIFTRLDHEESILSPLKVTNSERKFDFNINVKGGGIT